MSEITQADLDYIEQASAHADEGPLGEPAARSILAIATKLASANRTVASTGLETALDGLVTLARRFVYPQPDKPDSDWAKVQAGIDALAKARGETA